MEMLKVLFNIVKMQPEFFSLNVINTEYIQSGGMSKYTDCKIMVENINI